MTRWKNRRILAFVLAASLLFQEVPMTVLATGEKSTATEQEEKDTANNKEQEKENESQNADKVEENDQNQQDQSENSSQQTTEQEEPAEDEEPTPTADGDNMVVGNAVSLRKSEDFINLSNQDASTYETATITITREEAFDLTRTSDGKQFLGFGSAEHPFRGHIVITNASSGIEIPLNRSFFNYLDQSATIDEGLYLEAKGKCESPLLAANYTNKYKINNAGQKTIALKINVVEAVTGGDKSFEGLIGSMAAGSQLSLKVDNQLQAGTNISGSGNLGLFCNTMAEDSSLTIASYKGDQAYVVSSTNGHAGGLVGEMCDGAQLTVTPTLTLTGNVTGTGAAGGLVGKATDATITLNGDVTREGTIEAGQGQNTATGGFVGMAIYKKKNLSLDFNKFHSNHSNVTLGNGNHAGGLFGVLNYDRVDGGEIQITNVHTEVTLSGSSWQFGGIIGQYSANSQKSSLKIVSPEVTITQSGSTSSFGGVIGYIAGSDASDALENAEPSYVEMNGATVSAAATEGSTCTDGRFGGLVAEMGEGGHFLSVSGVVKVSSDTVGDKVPGLGGILGKAKNGVLRINGSTDLSGLKFTRAGNMYGQIAGDVNGTVIYALGSGNKDGNGTYGWKYIRPESAPVSDVGSYGEVIRLDGTKLTESGMNEQSDSTLFQYDENAHTVKVCYDATPASLFVNNVRDLVALSVIMQTGLTSSTGAYLCDTISNPLTEKNITISSKMNIDLSGTGCTGLLRDDGSQKYSGTFEGKDITIELATGEAYGFQTKDALAVNADGKSTNPGIGQIYNHSTIGFIPYCNGTVNHLNLSGSIYFNNVDGGEQVSCGALAGRTDGTSITNTVVNTSIVYNDGKGGSKLANVYAGGYIGSTTTDGANISFSDCSMQGKISSTSNCEHFAIGGYVAYVKANNTEVSVKNCKLEKTEIEFKRTANGNAQHAKMGGIIGYIGLSKNTHKVTIEGLTIDGCKMSSDADGTAGGFFGYQWFGTNVSLKGITVTESTQDTKGIFGGLVYQTSGYWKIGDGTDAGITFQGSNTLKGKTSKDSPSALLIADTSGITQSSGTSGDADNGNAKTYLEILKRGLEIDPVSVTLTGGDFFDDIAGKTKYSDNISSVVSIGLTSQSAENAELIDQSGCNTWHNQCLVNGKSDYTNGNTRYYYNVDYYRAKVGDSVDNIDTPGKLLLWSLNRYTSGTSNLSGYFKTGGSITGEIDLKGVSYYPVEACVDIHDATITFDYSAMNMNEKESSNKQYSDSNLQHYQMHTGLFSKVTIPSKDPVVLTVNHLTLKGDVGVYADDKAGVLLCDTAQGIESGLKVTMNLSDITLDGVYTAKNNKEKYPLLINAIGNYSAVNIAGVKVSGYTSGEKAGSSLLGTVGSSEGKEITLDFSDMDLNGAKNESIFSQASFALSFQYGDEVSGGSYNFETTTKNVTYGVEISNGLDKDTSHKHNRNSYNQVDGTGQVWYLDTFGQQDGMVYVSKDGASGTITDFTVNEYLPYIGAWENKDNDQTYHELDVNQMTVYMVEGCGTYGDPYHIKSVTNGKDTLFTGADQLTALMKILDGKGSGTAVCINPDTLNKKFQNAQQKPDIHTRDQATEKGDQVFIKSGAKWYAATSIKSGGRTRYTKDTSSKISYDNEQIVAYLRNAYYQIDEDIELNMARFTGIGGSSTSSAFSGVIIGNKEKTPTITLTGTSKTGATGGLVRYSQGSVVKNLNVNINGVTVTDMSGTDKFFGGVIGYVIGGDNIIDNVAVNDQGNGLTIENDDAKLLPVGGYVGLVGGADCIKGGGVIFRNMASQPGFTSVNTAKGSVAVNKEATNGNEYYYWNPYIGRVLDGFACSEGTALYNTDKNYTIPLLDRAQKLSISAKNGTDSVNGYGYTIYDKSHIIVDSAQDLWVLSAIINSGYGAKATNGYYGDPTLNTTGSEKAVSDASYYGHVRTGKYDNVGTADCDAKDDETDYWGGKLWNDKLTDHRNPSKAYLTSTYVEAQDTTAKNYEIASYLTYDKEYRSLQFANGKYDLSSYGNGFRGIGQGYMVNGNTRDYIPTKLRALRMGNRNNPAVSGNGATITYKRNILEYSANDTYSVKQAGLFPQFYCQTDYTVQNITLENCNITSNVLRNDTKFGLLYANDAYTGLKNVTFDSINISHSNIDGGYYSGGIFAYAQRNYDTINYNNCKIDDMSIVNATYSGAYAAGVAVKTVKTTVSFDNADSDGNVKNVKINTRNVDAGALRAGVLFGQTKNLVVDKIKEKDCEIRFHLRVGDKENNEPSNINKLSQFGGIAGGVTGGVTVTDTTIDGLKAICHGDVGGIVGNCTGSFDVQNVEVSNSKIVEKQSRGGVGALAGNVSAGVNGFDVLSNNNLVGYLVENGYNDFDCSTVKGTDGDIDLKKLSPDNVGLRIWHKEGQYYSYSNISNMNDPTDTRCGIWVGYRNSGDIKIVAASRIGDYSAMCNVGGPTDKPMSDNSYVIYADYQQTNKQAAKIHESPDNGILLNGSSLTGDGAALRTDNVSSQKDKALIKKIVAESTKENKMFAYRGGTQNNNLKSVIEKFAAGSAYDKLITTYKTEEPSSAYAATDANDIPILVLQAESTDTLTSLLKSYTSVLTNMNQEKKDLYTVEPRTYVYKDGIWTDAGDANQTISLNKSKQLRINPGKFDNTKNQITILDVKYESPVNAEDVYHLYIPVLVKKIMNVSFDIKMTNGAAGYASAYPASSAATSASALLAGYGEDFTANISFTYDWTVGEWKDALENGSSLLWSYDKKINIGKADVLNTEDTHLTLVNMNTHGTDTSYWQKDGTSLEKADSNYVLDLNNLKNQETYICDLLDLKVSEKPDGKFKKVSAGDSTATVRVWNGTAYDYYALKSEDENGGTYYNIEINSGSALGDTSSLKVTESYYLVVNCTKGSGMSNEKMTLASISGTADQIPVRKQQLSGQTDSYIYVLGDFYKDTALAVQTSAKVSGSQIMKAATNDYIDATVSSKVEVAVSADVQKDVEQYVISRPIYYQYAIQMVDDSTQPVDIMGNIVVSSVSLKKGDSTIDLQQRSDLNADGFVVTRSGSVCYITMRTSGRNYMNADISAKMRLEYPDAASLNAQFPLRNTTGGTDTSGVQFKANSAMAYLNDNLGSSSMSQHTDVEHKLYYREDQSEATISYDSYNISQKDGNTSQLGLNGRETKDQSEQITSRAFFDARQIPGFDQTSEVNEKYPYYFEGTLSLEKKNNDGIYERVNISSYLTDFFAKESAVDTKSSGLGAQGDVFKFRMSLSEKQVNEIYMNQILIPIDYKVKTGAELENVEGSQYANYKVTLTGVLKNKAGTELTNRPTDYLVYTNAKVYQKIVDFNDGTK